MTDRVFDALKKTLDAFFEGHNIAPEQRYQILERLLKSEKPPAAKKPYVSKVKVANARDINRMWAAHEKSQGKPTSSK